MLDLSDSLSLLDKFRETFIALSLPVSAGPGTHGCEFVQHDHFFGVWLQWRGVTCARSIDNPARRAASRSRERVAARA
jgi:hypothetical protein